MEDPEDGYVKDTYSRQSLRLNIEQARYGNLPGFGSNKDTVLDNPIPEEDADATDWCSVCSSQRRGVQLLQSPPPEIDNQFEEAGRQSPDTATKHAHTDFHHLDLL